LKIALAPGFAAASDVEKYNEEHPGDPIEIVWDSGTGEQQMANLQSGAVDALFGNHLSDISTLEAYGEDAFDVVGSNLFYDPAEKNGVYLLYNYGNEALQQEIDAAINQLLEDGTLSRLSEKILEVDVTAKPN
jgi:ABC-type amino acid transport substrate-binding protein